MPQRAGLPPFLRMAAILLVLFASGVLLFWLDWFVTGKHLREGTPCYRHFENSFPLPDATLCLLLFATAIALLRCDAAAVNLGALSAGMSLYLSAMDTAYHLQHGNFSNWTDGATWERAGISFATLVLGVGLPLYLARVRQVLSPRRWPRPGVAPTLFAGMFQLPSSIYALNAPLSAASCWLEFQAASLLGAFTLLVLGGSGMAMRFRKHREAEIWMGLALGAFLFWALLTGSFVLIAVI